MRKVFKDAISKERLPEITDRMQKNETKKRIAFVCGEVIL